MARVIISITTSPKVAAAGSTDGGYQWDIGSALTPVINTAEPTATFDSVAPGDYVATVRRINTDGSLVEPQADFTISQAFSIAAPPPPPPPPVDIMLDAPVGMTISIVMDAAVSA